MVIKDLCSPSEGAAFVRNKNALFVRPPQNKCSVIPQLPLLPQFASASITGNLNAKEPSYNPPLALTVISAISIGGAGLVSLWILLDIIQRKGWRTMMGVMIPVYVLNALYLAPITLWTYLKHGRPAKVRTDYEQIDSVVEEHRYHDHEDHGTDVESSQHEGYTSEQNGEHQDMSRRGPMQEDAGDHHVSGHSHMQHDAGERPIFATITIAVCHCGAGCLLGDIVGEWFVYGTGLEIDGSEMWVEFLADYVLALFFGIFFQYFSIAPMTGQYGLITLWRSAKADFLSLTFFEIGLFGWMAIFQVAIFDGKLRMNTVAYWWMMQVGMFLGHWTAFPINWWLIKTGVKEPCA